MKPFNQRYNKNDTAFFWNKKGAFFIVLSALLASVTNSCVHGLTSYISAGQLLFLKAGVAFILCSPWIIRYWKNIIGSPNKKWHVQKAVFGAAGNVFWITALQTLPLADASILSLTSALLTTLGATVFFKERLRFATLGALALGGLGVCIVIKPSMAVFSWHALLPLMSALCYSASSLFVKKVSVDDSTIVSLVYLLGGMTVLSAPFAYAAWVSLSSWDFLLIVSIAVFYWGIQWSLIYAYAHASAGFLAPFKFVRFPLACVIGVVFFAETPSSYVVGGAFLIFCACGLIQFTRHDPSHLFKTRSGQK
ncbi:MAG: DMT family transporter [Candidatus Paracaedibacteraceae bacterium]|nr:DMT family transporter [Candidatus Paracaedibacteraceae bacterium]